MPKHYQFKLLSHFDFVGIPGASDVPLFGKQKNNYQKHKY